MNTVTLPLAVTSDTHSSKLSASYQHIKTSDVLEQFQDHGWMVSSANSAKASKAPQHARHTVRLRHRDHLELSLREQVVPELIVLNSHNGTWALRMALGMFRMVCSNGMVAGNIWEGLTIRHSSVKDLEGRILDATQHMGVWSTELVSQINTWDQVEVPLELQLKFAEEARTIRWGEKSPVDPTMLLEARREADKGASLWKVFNRVQENLTQGGYNGTTTSGRNFAVKAIKNAKRDFKYNESLTHLANGLAAQLTH